MKNKELTFYKINTEFLKREIEIASSNLSCCINAWRKRGYIVTIDEHSFVLSGLLADVKQNFISIYTQGKQYVWLSDETFLSFEEVHLLSRTIKALEVKKNDY